MRRTTKGPDEQKIKDIKGATRNELDERCGLLIAIALDDRVGLTG